MNILSLESQRQNDAAVQLLFHFCNTPTQSHIGSPPPFEKRKTRELHWFLKSVSRTLIIPSKMKQKLVQVVKAVGHSVKKQVLRISKKLFSTAKSHYEKPPVAEKVQKTSTQIHTELTAVNGGTLFNKDVNKWTKKEAEAFVRIVNACSSIRYTTPGSTAAPRRCSHWWALSRRSYKLPLPTGPKAGWNNCIVGLVLQMIHSCKDIDIYRERATERVREHSEYNDR